MGLMTGDPAEAVASGAHALFFPHGLGHAMGLDVHDMEGLGEDHVGYGDQATRSEQFGTAYLRFGRPLATGHVMTVEPGCYFIGPLVEQWKAEDKHAEFLRYDEITRWVGLGGVRIEDDIVITADGHRVLGPPLAKTPEAIETVVRGG
jgi:Xaa-Pro aminopeptidase